MTDENASAMAPEPLCVWCRTEMQSTGVHEFRTGGTTGSWKLVFGEWAELGEEMLKLEVLACPACRRIDFRLPAP